MKPIHLALIFFFLLSGCVNNREKQYVFFLHNKFIEENSLDTEHPTHGVAEYKKILEALKKSNYIVISEKRDKNTNVKIYAKKISVEIKKLMEHGVRANNIAVIGTSKGGQIAQHVSANIKNKNIKYVFIGSEFNSENESYRNLNICGNILSIREKSDTGSISIEDKIKKSSCFPMHYKDIEINTNMGHGFLFKLKNEWFLPTINWINTPP